MNKQKDKKKEHNIPKESLLDWTADAIKSGKEGMLIIFNKDKKCYFPHYALPNYGLWDTAVILQKQGYEVVEFHVFREKDGEET